MGPSAERDIRGLLDESAADLERVVEGDPPEDLDARRPERVPSPRTEDLREKRP
jgi:hypothetical protein